MNSLELIVLPRTVPEIHYPTVHKVNEMMRNITKLEKAIAEKEGFMSLAHTRLGNRAHRPEMELCSYLSDTVEVYNRHSVLRETYFGLRARQWEAYPVYGSSCPMYGPACLMYGLASSVGRPACPAVPEQLPHIIDQLSLCVRSCSFPAESFRLYTVVQKPCAAVMVPALMWLERDRGSELRNKACCLTGGNGGVVYGGSGRFFAEGMLAARMFLSAGSELEREMAAQIVHERKREGVALPVLTVGVVSRDSAWNGHQVPYSYGRRTIKC
ncbi:unnamed protein product [Timema podura]|uniref:Uncharacterized protein n=1 Tax=Timema podura TaxID=61482 RepID=A0ABN7NZS8_TIMPD|nr:unnamed protein product [Timema podura]